MWKKKTNKKISGWWSGLTCEFLPTALALSSFTLWVAYLHRINKRNWCASLNQWTHPWKQSVDDKKVLREGLHVTEFIIWTLKIEWSEWEEEEIRNKEKERKQEARKRRARKRKAEIENAETGKRGSDERARKRERIPFSMTYCTMKAKY